MSNQSFWRKCLNNDYTFKELENEYCSLKKADSCNTINVWLKRKQICTWRFQMSAKLPSYFGHFFGGIYRMSVTYSIGWESAIVHDAEWCSQTRCNDAEVHLRGVIGRMKLPRCISMPPLYHTNRHHNTTHTTAIMRDKGGVGYREHGVGTNVAASSVTQHSL
jgi:hypothetical protein